METEKEIIISIEKEKQLKFNLFINKKNADIIIIESFVRDVLEELYKITKHHKEWYPVGAFKNMDSVHFIIDDWYESVSNLHKKRKIFIVENVFTVSNATLVLPAVYTKEHINDDRIDFVTDVDDKLNNDLKNPEKCLHRDTSLVNADKKYLKPGVWG